MEFVCPVCRGPLRGDEAKLTCPPDSLEFANEAGIWRFLAPERRAALARFVADYERIREREQRGSADPGYYRALPFRDLTGRFVKDWQIRAASYRTLLRHAVVPMAAARKRPLRILDLGAGNGWLSNQLAKLGHQVAAVDILTNDRDGLGAWRHYDTRFTQVEAEFDRLPLADGWADLVIYNGSFHYATRYETVLGEALRVSSRAARVVIMDSPVYHQAASGYAMVREREERFEREHGTASNSVESEHFLTYDRLAVLGERAGLSWKMRTPWVGAGWAAGPIRAQLRGTREPAKFHVIIGRRSRTVADCRTPAVDTLRPASLLATALRTVFWTKARLVDLPRANRPVLETVAGYPMIVLPEVFNPRLFRSGEVMAETLESLPLTSDESVLDLGCGSGIGSVVAAQRAGRVVAVDINPEAVRCATLNAALHRLEARIDVRQGDLFGPVAGERFDRILFNPPFFRGRPATWRDHAWRSEDVVERFSARLAEHLTPGGHALVVLSTDGDLDGFLKSFAQAGHTVTPIVIRDLKTERMLVLRVAPGAPRC